MTTPTLKGLREAIDALGGVTLVDAHVADDCETWLVVQYGIPQHPLAATGRNEKYARAIALLLRATSPLLDRLERAEKALAERDAEIATLRKAPPFSIRLVSGGIDGKQIGVFVDDGERSALVIDTFVASDGFVDHTVTCLGIREALESAPPRADLPEPTP